MFDYYDVYEILKYQELYNDTLSAAICATFRNREIYYFNDHPLFSKEFATDEERNKLWMRFLKRIIQDIDLSFGVVMTLITSRLNPIYETFK